MLYWICPECGGECSPAIRECPVCAGTPAISPASADPVHRKSGVTEEVIALVQNLQATAHSPIPPLNFPPPAHPAINGLSNGNGCSTQIATLDPPEVPAGQESGVPPKEAIESLVRPLIESTTLALPPAVPPELSEAMALQAELVLDSIAQEIIDKQSAIRGIVASFQKQPKISLLAPASEVVTAPAPVCIQWMRIPRPRITPVAPKDLNHGDLLSGHQTPPLAGPCVPGELRSLIERRHPTHGQARKKAGLPAWTVSFLVALTLFLAVGSLLQYLSANRDAKAATTTSQPLEQSASNVTAGEPPASKLVEVTGLRIASGPNQRPQLEFIVVNHSAIALSGVGLRIAVRSASSQLGVAPLFRVSTTIPSLGAYQSREFRAELDPEVHATDVPDWQSLRADVRITQ
jgi:hypothetical protein